MTRRRWTAHSAPTRAFSVSKPGDVRPNTSAIDQETYGHPVSRPQLNPGTPCGIRDMGYNEAGTRDHCEAARKAVELRCRSTHDTRTVPCPFACQLQRREIWGAFPKLAGIHNDRSGAGVGVVVGRPLSEPVHLLHHRHSLHNLPKDSVLPVQVRRRVDHDGHMGSVAVGALVGHGQQPLVLVLQGQPAGVVLELAAKDAIGAGTRLYDETVDDAVEGRALQGVLLPCALVALRDGALLASAQRSEVLCCTWRLSIKENYRDSPYWTPSDGHVQVNHGAAEIHL
mmetsp:Transcript_2992/g.8453  ORF Transcript_2992/g.8453 Transcript_2992/m.8453 type:complete len:284 (+) Transcript_2992:292-1143(+)|eukprot:CAMPEP_0117653178 /NCGR_PEP_ID=MMETSP0804-20121206/3048_1 /TAXON_ID=1074897 /ORGANISM="Tetraselmis astigmatica, Strain CCMP880" /LENGTH=283 /DNA_ID=CAMNT_0005459327 /DNA_START=192 /DNA_END=1043 /DNA_ORIENTATION=-